MVFEGNDQVNNVNKKKSIFSIIYKIYHFIAKIVLYALLIILIMIAAMFILYFVDMQKNLKEGVTKQPLFGAYIIISPSMVPTIKVEDAVVIQRNEINEYKVGDIITFVSSDPRYSGVTITHRIVGIEKTKNNVSYFRTKGDNNNTEDATLVSYENIYGKVILKIPKIGYLQQLLVSAYGWIFLIVVPCLGIVIYDIIKLLKKFFKKKDKTKKLSSKTKIKTINSIKNDDNNDDIEII